MPGITRYSPNGLDHCLLGSIHRPPNTTDFLDKFSTAILGLIIHSVLSE